MFSYIKTCPYHFFLGKGVSVSGIQAFRCPLDSCGSRGGARGAWPPLFLDQTEARRPQKTCFGDHSPPPPRLSKGLDDRLPLISRSGSLLDIDRLWKIECLQSQDGTFVLRFHSKFYHLNKFSRTQVQRN